MCLSASYLTGSLGNCLDAWEEAVAFLPVVGGSQLPLDVDWDPGRAAQTARVSRIRSDRHLVSHHLMLQPTRTLIARAGLLAIEGSPL